jgi:xanthine dehydrogenase large subunit
MFIIESAIALAAEKLGVEAWQIQEKNLIESGQEFPYGQKVESEAAACWQSAFSKFDWPAWQEKVKAFNAENKLQKKGLACMPICFGISFTNTRMNQARSLVHVYTDGSVVVSTGAVEMGQGVNTKILQVAATVLGIDPSRVRINSTNTYRIANTSPSAASATADLNGKATYEACLQIRIRLLKLAASEMQLQEQMLTIIAEQVCADGRPTALGWLQLVSMAYDHRISLSEHGHYSTPDLHFDKAKEKGHPFAYHVFGNAITEVTVDCVRGTYVVDAVKMVHDFGSSMNPLIDKGQIEGGLIQGIGWMTLEEIVYDASGKLRSNALSTYKVPDIYSVPRIVEIESLTTSKDNLAIFRSKAVGEPPLMYGIGTFFALRNAIRQFNPKSSPAFDAPMTPEKVLMNLYGWVNSSYSMDNATDNTLKKAH